MNNQLTMSTFSTCDHHSSRECTNSPVSHNGRRYARCRECHFHDSEMFTTRDGRTLCPTAVDYESVRCEYTFNTDGSHYRAHPDQGMVEYEPDRWVAEEYFREHFRLCAHPGCETNRYYVGNVPAVAYCLDHWDTYRFLCGMCDGEAERPAQHYQGMETCFECTRVCSNPEIARDEGAIIRASEGSLNRDMRTPDGFQIPPIGIQAVESSDDNEVIASTSVSVEVGDNNIPRITDPYTDPEYWRDDDDEDDEDDEDYPVGSNEFDQTPVRPEEHPAVQAVRQERQLLESTNRRRTNFGRDRSIVLPTTDNGWQHEDVDDYISSYNYRPEIQPRGANKSGLLFGWEVETEPSPRPVREGMDEPWTNLQASFHVTQNSIDNQGNVLYCKRDGSVYNGFEVVSHPMSFEWLMDDRNQQYINTVFELADHGYRSHEGGSCGMHVHMDAIKLSNLHYYKMLRFLYKPGFYEFFKRISQRTDSQISAWCNLRLSTAGQMRRATVYGSKSYELSNMMDHTKIAAKRTVDRRYMLENRAPHGRRTALNSTGRTIELRLPRGTIRKDRFLKNIEFAHSLWCYSDCTAIPEIQRLPNYFNFLEKWRGTYKNLYKFIHGYTVYEDGQLTEIPGILAELHITPQGGVHPITNE